MQKRPLKSVSEIRKTPLPKMQSQDPIPTINSHFIQISSIYKNVPTSSTFLGVFRRKQIDR